MANKDTQFKKGMTPWNKGMGAFIKCAVCGTEKWFQNWQLKSPTKGKFCSKKCCYIGRELKGTFEKGHAKSFLGVRVHTTETREKISKTLQAQKNIGDKNWNWKGGVTKIDKLVRRMAEYVLWRTSVFIRDNWECKNCGVKGCYITAHHIKGLSKLIREKDIKNILDARKCSELWDLNNGITLCEDCHKLTDNYKGRAKTL